MRLRSIGYVFLSDLGEVVSYTQEPIANILPLWLNTIWSELLRKPHNLVLQIATFENTEFVMCLFY